MQKNQFLTKRNEPVTMNLYDMPEATGGCDNCGEDTYETDDRTYHCHSMNADCYRAPLQESEVYPSSRTWPAEIRGVDR